MLALKFDGRDLSDRRWVLALIVSVHLDVAGDTLVLLIYMPCV